MMSVAGTHRKRAAISHGKLTKENGAPIRAERATGNEYPLAHQVASKY
jgi:hypothetical protein